LAALRDTAAYRFLPSPSRRPYYAIFSDDRSTGPVDSPTAGADFLVPSKNWNRFFDAFSSLLSPELRGGKDKHKQIPYERLCRHN
jgi:hypothetical protein